MEPEVIPLHWMKEFTDDIYVLVSKQWPTVIESARWVTHHY